MKKYKTNVEKFKRFFNCLPLVGMVVKSSNGKYFEVIEINESSNNTVVAKELFWYELFGVVHIKRQ